MSFSVFVELSISFYGSKSGLLKGAVIWQKSRINVWRLEKCQKSCFTNGMFVERMVFLSEIRLSYAPQNVRNRVVESASTRGE